MSKENTKALFKNSFPFLLTNVEKLNTKLYWATDSTDGNEKRAKENQLAKHVLDLIKEGENVLEHCRLE